MKWRELGAVQQTGIRCKDPVFRAFLKETYPDHFNDPGDDEDIYAEQNAAHTVRSLCGVDSRSELDKPGHSEARAKWCRLDDAFQAWKVAEHA